MPREHRARLCAHAAAYLFAIGCDAVEPFVITLERGRERHVIPCVVAPAVATGPAKRPGRWLSPLEERILAALEGRDWTPTRTIAEAIQEDPEGDIRAILRNLVERSLLESCPRGFRQVVPDRVG